MTEKKPVALAEFATAAHDNAKLFEARDAFDAIRKAGASRGKDDRAERTTAELTDLMAAMDRANYNILPPTWAAAAFTGLLSDVQAGDSISPQHHRAFLFATAQLLRLARMQQQLEQLGVRVGVQAPPEGTKTS